MDIFAKSLLQRVKLLPSRLCCRVTQGSLPVTVHLDTHKHARTRTKLLCVCVCVRGGSEGLGVGRNKGVKQTYN